jgi:hypothetical protein
MHEMGEWGVLPERSRTRGPTRDRLVYLEHLREVHDDDGFRLALCDELTAAGAELDRFLFEAEMLANYHVL